MLYRHACGVPKGTRQAGGNALNGRRDFLGLAGSAAAGSLFAGPLHAQPAAEDWAGRYDVDRSIANFDAAYYGAMTKTVAAAYRQHGEWVNRHNALFLRSALPGPSRDARLQPAIESVATLVGAKPGEIALCAGGTEALYGLIVNYRPLKAGEAVLTADTDYDEMQFAMAHLAATRDARHVRIALPEPATTANILAAYAQALRDTPRLKLLLLTHVSNRNGLVLPVREIAAIAKAQGVDVILDSAQSVGLLPVDVAALGVDFMGFSLHKWVAAPLGSGAVYIRADRLGDIAPWLGNHIHTDDDIRARVPSGTVDVAARLTIPAAIAEHHALGPAQKLVTLVEKRRYWVDRVRDVPGLTIVHPEEADRCAVIGAFRLPGQASWEQARAAQQRLLVKHRVLVVAKQGLASGPVLRVTPSLFNTTDELDHLARAIQAERCLFA
ncbi:aminotransferase class V-fold PLP-dependent enzyme [Sphingomonas sp. ABOLD]|nr:aminotransferase class V-fold PLP-dependent enzyme [Sphingomonas sp. ABOLD]